MAKKKQADGNGLYDPRDLGIELTKENAPKSPVEAKRQKLNVYYDRQQQAFVKMRYKSRASVKHGMKYESGLLSNYQNMRSRNNRQRRATVKGKIIPLQERYDWYRRNLYDNPMQRAMQDHADDARLRDEQAAQLRREGKAYEHLSPLASDSMGGFEHHRNIDGADPTLNLKKSDKVASLETYRKNRVPTNRQSAIRMDAHKVPIPNHDRFVSVYEDIEKNQRPKSALKDQLRLKAKSKLAKNRAAAQAAEAAKHGGRYSGFMKGLRAIAKAAV